MVFGELLGGLATRAGERFNEDRQRQRRIEDWQREQHLGFLTDQAKNWDNLDADQQMALGTQIGQAVGVKDPKVVEGWITAAKGIHSIIPQIQATPASLGSAQRTGTVTATPSTEAPIRGIHAPASITLSDVPQPGQLLSPSIMAPSTGGVARYGRNMTPNQIKAQQLAEQQRFNRQQNIADFQADPRIPAEYKPLMTAGEYGFKGASGYELGMAGIDQRTAVANQRFLIEARKLSAVYGQPSVVKRGTQNVFMWQTKEGPVNVDADGNLVRHVPQEGDVLAQTGSQSQGSDFKQYITRLEGELGRPLTAAEVQNERNRFPDSAVKFSTVTPSGQHVETAVPRSVLVNRGRGAGLGGTSRGQGAGAGSGKPGVNLGQVPSPQVGGGGFFSLPSQPSSAESKVSDENELAYNQILALEKLHDPEFLGAVRGGSLDWTFRSKFPEIASFLRPEITTQEAAFRSFANSLRNNIIHLISGAAVSPSEGERILAELPDPSRPGDWEGQYLKTKANAVFLLNAIRKREGKPQIQPPALPGQELGAGPTIIDSTRGSEGYGPIENATVDGKPTRVQKNLKTGKYRRVD